MKYTPIKGKTLKRYKRFFADVELEDGSIVQTHCVNTGPMNGCWAEGVDCIVSPAANPDRKLKYTLEMTKIDNTWIGVNTHRPNKIVAEACSSGLIFSKNFQAEYSMEDSRFDFFFPEEKLLIEVKSVTLKEHGIALFPDTVSTRAQKHVQDLMKLKKQGFRVGVLFLIQRQDCEGFLPAQAYDPEYARLLSEAYENGLEIYAFECNIEPGSIELGKSLPVLL